MRRTYAAVYRAFAAFLGPQATAEGLTPEAVRAYRDRLERAGRSPATVAKHLSALRDLAAAVGADQAIGKAAEKEQEEADEGDRRFLVLPCANCERDRDAGRVPELL